MSKIQMRGHCQCCGRDQAVVRGNMSKHGYTVEWSYFKGVCPGQHYAPIEVERTEADATIASVRQQAKLLLQQAADLVAGRIHPEMCRTDHQQKNLTTGKWETVVIAWEDASSYQRESAVKGAIYECESNAKHAGYFADSLEKVCNEFHGKPLVEVAAAEAPAAIVSGEVRVAQNGTRLTCKYIHRGMVEYSYHREEQNRTFSHRMATRSWRALPLAS